MTYIMGKKASSRHERAIESMHPVFKDRITTLIGHLRTKGWHAYVFQGKNRTTDQAEQNQKKGTGITKSWHRPDISGRIGGQVYELYAADVVDERWGWEGPCKALSHPFWVDLGNYAESLGLEWGGRWKKRDVAHVQMMIADAPEQNSAVV